MMPATAPLPTPPEPPPSPPTSRLPPPPGDRRQQWIIGLVVVPLSFLSARWQALAGALGRWRRAQRAADGAAALSDHERRVRRVEEEVRAWAALPEAGRPPLRTDRSPKASHSVRASDKRGARQVRMGDFRHVLGLDRGAGTVTVEPFVTVGELTSFLLPHGLMLQATLEMEDATLGGLALSQGMTTHSHRCGLVHDTVVAYELVTGEGRRLRASAEENADVFHAAGFSHGSLGLLTSLTLRVVPAERELLVTYRRFGSVGDLQRAFRAAIEGGGAPGGAAPMFLEAIIHAPDQAVLIAGDPVDAAEAALLRRQGVPPNRQGRWYKPWFFGHAGRVDDGRRELMPMRDYLMRHDRSLCMTMKYVFPAGDHPVVRHLVGWMLPPKVTFLKALRPPAIRLETARGQVYQDLAVPAEHLVPLVELVERELDVFPLLVYPCALFDRGGFLRHPGRAAAPGGPPRLYFNLGVYGVPGGVRERRAGFDTIASVRTILAWVRARGGFQHSYCDVFQTRAEFEAMFDHRLADEVRRRVGSTALPVVYDKVRPEVDWEGPPPG